MAERDFDAALGQYRQVLAMGFSSWSIHQNIAQCLKRAGDLRGAFLHFDAAFAIRRKPQSWAGPRPPATTALVRDPVSSVFISHLREQLGYLASAGICPWYDEDLDQELASLAAFIEAAHGPAGFGRLDVASNGSKALLTQAPHRPMLDGDVGPILSENLVIEEIELSGGDGDRVFVIDDLFSAPALARLMRTLLESTIWFDARPGRRYLGAHLHDGLATPFMLTVAQAMHSVIERLAGSVSVAQMWAFRYLADSKGIDIHADQGDWNLNIWPVATTALQDAGERGGMTIYDLKIGEDVAFERYNSEPDINRARVEQAGAKAHVVPYKGNRAVMFPSKYLHKTNAAVFGDAYADRRINFTLMADRLA